MVRSSLVACLFSACLFSVADAQVEREYNPPAVSDVLPANPHAAEPGLLFYLSGDASLVADYAAGGNPVPNYAKHVAILPQGVRGSYMQCENNQQLSYWAPGNIYAQRGTLSFFWRARTPLDETEFPLFRVSYADHSSWDMVWLRIDWNGHGFDAFVTDVNLGRTRVSVTLPQRPKPEQWLHLALAWDENSGIRFYIDGKLAATQAATGLYATNLDQLGPHSRLIAPTGVESTYNYDRAGDIDELRIYDRALSDENIAGLAKNEIPEKIPELRRSLDETAGREEWNRRFGWDRAKDVPVVLDAASTVIRKVEIHDAYDLKRWWWKATDGIRETTWPGVYNRSRLTGRHDYFTLPDWDCYSLSGKAITFYLPEEPWNHLEISGGAWGAMALLHHDLESATDKEEKLFERPKGQELTFHHFDEPVTGGKLRFTNAEQEEPIGEFSAYFVHAGREPAGAGVLRYNLTARVAATENASTRLLADYIRGAYPADERQTMMAMPGVGARRGNREDALQQSAQAGLPIVHILVPADFRNETVEFGHGFSYGWENMDGGLDGIALDLPALSLKANPDGLIPLHIEVRDPLWPMRAMLSFSFAVRPGAPHTLWLDVRDRILPNGKSLYLTIASENAAFGPSALEGAALRLVFKPYKDALTEHIADRLTQVRDEYANLVEESVNSRRFNLFNRIDADLSDLLRVDPRNELGRAYWAQLNREQIHPDYAVPQAPAGVPQWAYLQVEDLGALKKLINWYVDNRQIANGEFGGGLSDDSDFTEWWPGLALMGSTPDKLKASLNKELDAMYDQHMFTNGLATIQTDELHSYEDGINVLGESMLLDYGSPKQMERAMVTAKRLEWLSGINAAGHRHIRSNYFSGAKMAENGVWGSAKDNSYMVFHPALSLVSFNGTPETRKMVLELADGILAHYRPNTRGELRTEVNFKTDEDKPTGMRAWFVLWAAYRWTGDAKYVKPFVDAPLNALGYINADALDMLDLRKSQHDALASFGDIVDPVAGEAYAQLAWQATGDARTLEKVYASQLRTAHEREFINTKGSLWIDRVYFNSDELQRARLGGVALIRNYCYPGHVVSWRFAKPANDESVAILIPEATPTHIRIIAYNLDNVAVKAQMTGWEIDPGQWQWRQGNYASPNGQPPAAGTPLDNTVTRMVAFERSSSLEVSFAPHTMTVLELDLKEKGVPYWSRPDLGIDDEDVKIAGAAMSVTVHSVGAVDAPVSRLVLRDAAGKALATTPVPALKAPSDLTPKTATVRLSIPAGVNLKGATVSVECGGTTPEITQNNNVVRLGAQPLR
jgi:hypothetical protein